METLNQKKISVSTAVALSLVVMAAIFCISFFMLPNEVLAAGTAADISSKITAGITSFTAELKKIVNPIGVVSVVICGIYMLTGSDPQTLKKVKSWAFSILIGLVIVNLAEPLVNWASSLGA